MTILKYIVKGRGYAPKIEIAEIIRETDASVWVPTNRNGERREAKHSDFADYFDTFSEAQKFLLDFWHEKVESTRLQLEVHKSVLGNIKGMKDPLAALNEGKETK